MAAKICLMMSLLPNPVTVKHAVAAGAGMVTREIQKLANFGLHAAVENGSTKVVLNLMEF